MRTFHLWFVFDNLFRLQLGNHDNHRLASRLGKNRIDLFNIMLKTLPGVAITYMVRINKIILFFSGTYVPILCHIHRAKR